MEHYVSDEQFGFRSGRGTKEAILALRVILKRELDKKQNKIVAFIDLEKVFFMVNWK